MFFERTSGSHIGETGKHLLHNVAVPHVLADVRLSLLLEGWDVVLDSASKEKKDQTKSGPVTLSASR